MAWHYFCCSLLIYGCFMCGYGFAVREEKKVMVIHNVALEDSRGGDSHVYVTLQALAQLGYKVTLFYGSYQNRTMLDLAEMGVDVDFGTPITLKMKLLRENYVFLIEFFWGNMGHARLLRAFNLVIGDAAPSMAIMVLSPDIFHLRQEKEYGAKNLLCKTCGAYKEVESYFWKKSDIVVGVNENIVRIAKQLAPKAVGFHLPYAYQEKIDFNENTPYENRKGVIYFGGWVPANGASADWLAQEVAPQLLREHGEYLQIFGGVKMKYCNESSGCVYNGVASTAHLNAAIKNARWMVAPIFTEAGVSTKVIKSLALGTPVMTTPYGLGGMESITGPKPIVLANMSDFKSTFFHILKNKEIWTEKQSFAKTFIQDHFSLENLKKETQKLVDLSRSVVEKRHGPRLSVLAAKLHVLFDVAPPSTSSRFSSIHELFPYLQNTFHLVIAHNGCPVGHPNVDVFVRLKESNDLSRPSCCPQKTCRFITYLSWDYGYLPLSYLSDIKNNVDAVWALSNYHYNMFEASGLSARKLRNMPFGVTCPATRPIEIDADIRKALQIKPTQFVYGYVDDGIGFSSHVIQKIKGSLWFREKKQIIVLILSNNNTLLSKWSGDVKAYIVDKKKVAMKDFYGSLNALVQPVGSVWNMAAVESFVAGVPVLTNSGFLDDYFFLTNYPYLVMPANNKCTEYPCSFDSVCLPTAASSLGCEKLVLPPLILSTPENGWALMDRMERIKKQSQSPNAEITASLEGQRDFICSKFSWSEISKLFIWEISRKNLGENSWRHDRRAPRLLRYFYTNPDLKRGIYDYEWDNVER